MGRRGLLLLIAAFVLTRLSGAWLADHPGVYAGDAIGVTGDVGLYEQDARSMIEDGKVPYSEVAFEYPPASLPFVALPQLLPVGSYRERFVIQMLLFDVAGLLGLLALARRHGSRRSIAGPWLWMLLLPLVGPMVWLRLDLIPAVASIWAMHGLAAGSPARAGAWLGFGVLAKLYPALILPPAIRAAACPGRVLAAFGIVLGLLLLPFAPVASDLYDEVVRFHLARGIQIESTWGAGLLAAQAAGRAVEITFDHGAYELAGRAAQAIRPYALGLLIAALGPAFLLALGAQRRDPASAATAAAGLLAVATALATVFSPQYLLWLAALAAAAMCTRRSPARATALLLVPAAALTQAVYPFLYDPLIEGAVLPVVVLAVRNLLVLAAGVAALALLRSRTVPTPGAAVTTAA